MAIGEREVWDDPSGLVSKWTDTGVELLLKKWLGNSSKFKLCLMDFLFLLEKAWEDSPGSLRLTLGVRINGDAEAWAVLSCWGVIEGVLLDLSLFRAPFTKSPTLCLLFLLHSPGVSKSPSKPSRDGVVQSPSIPNMAGIFSRIKSGTQMSDVQSISTYTTAVCRCSFFPMLADIFSWPSLF